MADPTLKKHIQGPPNKENPWGDDKLGLQQIAKHFEQLLSTITQPYVISFSAPYGAGKSFFCERFHLQLKNNGYPTVWVNAWSDDYVGDPLAHLTSVLSGSLKKQNILTPDSSKKLVLQSAKVLARSLVPTAAKVATKLTLGIDTDDIGKALADGAGEINQKWAEKLVGNFDQQKKDVEKFKSILSAAAKKAKNNKQIIIFVDEFDRCRPIYAIQLLEVLKHLFDVNGITFVLISDEEYMESCVKSCYPGMENARGYLRKFIDWNFRLPEPNISDYAEYLIHSFNLDEILIEGENNWFSSKQSIVDVITQSSKTNRLQLRDLDKIFSAINFTIRSLHAAGEPLFAPCVAFLACMRETSGEYTQGLLKEKDIDSPKHTHSVPSPFDTIGYLNILILIANSNQLDRLQSDIVQIFSYERPINPSHEQIGELQAYRLWHSRVSKFKEMLGFIPNVTDERIPFESLSKKIIRRLEFIESTTGTS